MREIIGALSFVVAVITAGYIGWISHEEVMLQECRRQHNVYACDVIAIPVNPDGQPLDLADPFHPEEPTS